MSTFALPPNLSRRGRTLLAWAFTVIDDTGEVKPTGEPPSALTTLRGLMGHHPKNIWEALRDLESEGLATTWRASDAISRRGPLRVRILLNQLRVEGQCAEPGCGSPAKGTGRWCARCKQIFGRDDRGWQVRALEMHHMGMSPTRIAVKLGRPVYVASDEDGRDPNGGAVVPFLLGKGELGPEWAQRLRDAQRGASVSDEE